MPPPKGSFMMNTSPGSISPSNFCNRVSIADGTAPIWKGMVVPCAIWVPAASHSEVEKSNTSRTMVEYAVRYSPTAISSAAEARAFLMIARVMGSTVVMRDNFYHRRVPWTMSAVVVSWRFGGREAGRGSCPAVCIRLQLRIAATIIIGCLGLVASDFGQ